MDAPQSWAVVHQCWQLESPPDAHRAVHCPIEWSDNCYKERGTTRRDFTLLGALSCAKSLTNICAPPVMEVPIPELRSTESKWSRESNGCEESWNSEKN